MKIKRLHLFEWMDLPFLPSFLRNGMTDVLSFYIREEKIYRQVTPLLIHLLQQSGARTIIDLCSGAGGPLLSILPDLAREELKIELTDKYPSNSTSDLTQEKWTLHYHPESVDALNVPLHLSGVRTLFTAFHHFRPEEARALLADSVNKKQSLAIFEFTERRFMALLPILIGPITCLLITPRLRPIRFSRYLFTYAIPLIPLLLLWDGIVSCLRSYKVEELKNLAKEYPEFRWVAGQVRSEAKFPTNITYLMGMPPAPNQH